MSAEVPDPAARLYTLLRERVRLLAFVERQVGSRELAEEILQDAFVRGLEKAARVRADESVMAWFYRLLRNAIVDGRRRQATREWVKAEFSRELNAFLEGADEERGEICACMPALVETLKPEYERAIRTVDLAGGSLVDLARIDAITPGNAAVRLHRARLALGKKLRATCGACAEHGCLDCSCMKHPSAKGGSVRSPSS